MLPFQHSHEKPELMHSDACWSSFGVDKIMDETLNLMGKLLHSISPTI